MKKKIDNESADTLNSNEFQAARNMEMYEVLLSAGLDLQTLKSMMQHKKETSIQLKENTKKLVKLLT